MYSVEFYRTGEYSSMDHRLFQSVGFWVFLFSIDKKFATEACLAGCPCGGRLHRADYPRKPRGGAKGLPREYNVPAELLL